MLGILEFRMSRSDAFPQVDMSYDPGKSYNPISELMRAIVLRAVEDLNYTGEIHEAARAFFDDDEEDYIFSFRAICRTLGLDPDAAREAILFSGRKIRTRRRAA